ncbi:MAG TPA: imidazole glycerol phosphate synthase subunit HisH [Candidatus Binatia bacterium]|nr:imidazole glycerol phosphate synthase subunit HisH [Candidatus Binatia bacterium]
MIAVVDYGVGNLRSVSKALEHVGAQVTVTSDASVIESAGGVVLPGVGAFAHCMNNLAEAGLEGCVRAAAASTRPFLGVCVGMQILFEESDEFGRVPGLGILPGRVRRFEPAAHDLKVPHMGWNELVVRNRAPHLAGLDDGTRVYFVHSYYVETPEPSIIATTTPYGVDFVSSAWRGNIFATQFHPEKSQDAGLKILGNFARLVEASEAGADASGSGGVEREPVTTASSDRSAASAGLGTPAGKH